MRLQGLSPGMQDAEESDLRAEMFGVGGHFQQGGRRGLEQESKQDLLILPDQRHEAVRHAEDQVVVAYRQEFLLPLMQPLLPGIGLTLRAVPITARVVRDGLITAAQALVAVPATRAAPADGLASVHSMLIVVVLPAPLGPRNPKTSPVATSKRTSRTAWMSSKDLLRPSTAMAGGAGKQVILGLLPAPILA